MTSKSKLERDLEVVRRAMGFSVKPGADRAAKILALLKEWEEASKHLTVEEKRRLEREVAQDYADGKISST